MSETPEKKEVVKKEESKKPWESKTNWAALIVAAASFFPVAGDWVKENPEFFMRAMGGVFTILRLVTNGKVSVG